MDSELFGHEKGAFTGAHDGRKGYFEVADGGTIFLDEVGELPMSTQARLLRILETGEFIKVDSSKVQKTNVRIVAASNVNIPEAITKGRFREDLFYRLNVVPIFLPALCDRKEDIERLVNIFVKKFNEVHRKKITGVTADAMNILKKYSWPGNIRELENVIEHSFVLESNHVISIASLPESVLAAVGVNLIDLDSLIESEKTNEQANNSELNSSGSFAKAPVFVDSGIDINDEDSDLSEDDVEDSDALGMKVTFNGELDFNAQKEVFEKEFIIKALKTFKGRINQTALHGAAPRNTARVFPWGSILPRCEWRSLRRRYGW